MNKKILVLCTGNSCRSQMAEGYLRHFAEGKAEIYSAGIETHGVNTLAIKAMQRDGIDISAHTCNHVDDYRAIVFDLIITVCDHAKENCPFIPSTAKRFHSNFPDPAKATGTPQHIAEEFDRVRDQVKAFCKTFISENL